MRDKKTQKRLLWCDAEANCHQLSTQAGVAEVVENAARANIDTLIVDVKPLIGEVLYISKYAPRLGEIDGQQYPESFDLLEAMIQEAHPKGIKVHAAINVFSEGHRQLERGPAFDHPDWQVVMYEAGGVFRSAAESEIPSWGIFVNPIGPARIYELQIIEEIVSGYDIDGITFDRMRYPNLYADFSTNSREAFEKWLGCGQIHWPDDVFLINNPPSLPPMLGKYYTEWLEWRAWQIHNFAEEAAGLVRAAKPDVKIGVYVGSWYESYFDVGVNWGSAKFHPGYSWMTPGYNKTGFAELFDYICAGCYYPVTTREEARKLGKAEGATVEAGCQLSRKAIGNAAPVYGSLYLRDYQENPEQFIKAINVALSNSDGVMLFDLVQLEEYGWWQILEGI